MAEVVGRFPVVEDFVTVLNGREGGGDEVSKGEDAEGRDDAELGWLLRRSSIRMLVDGPEAIEPTHKLCTYLFN
jgi:hypothetical protein